VKGLTKKQTHVYKKILEYEAEYHRLPTLKEVCEFVGSKNISTAQYYMDILKKKNCIVPSRSLNILDVLVDLEKRVRVLERR